MEISSSKYPIGLTLPLTVGDNGFFNQSFDTNTQIKTNLLNFLRTRRGERRMFPEFGTKIYENLFDIDSDDMIISIKDTLSAEINYWIPEVEIVNMDVYYSENPTDDDNYKVKILIKFKIKKTEFEDSLEFNIE